MTYRRLAVAALCVALPAVAAVACGGGNTPADSPATTAEHDMTKMPPGESMPSTTHDMSNMKPGETMPGPGY
jgi:hypothetical protein